MPFCPKCGAEYQDGTKFCGKCGGNLDGTVAPVPVVNQGPGFFQKILNTKDVTSTMNAADITSGKPLAILAYCACFVYILMTWLLGSFVGLLLAAGVLVAPCIIASKYEFLKYHLSQAFTALFGVILVNIVEGFFASILRSLIVSAMRSTAGNVVGTIIAWIIHLIFMAIPVLIIIAGLINAAKGKAKALPLIGRFRFICDK